MAGRGLLRSHADFRRLWVGESISEFGSQVSMLAVPLTAVLTLRAGTFAVGVLSAMGYLPSLVFGLFAGVWVDRMRRRPVLIAGNLARAVLLVAVPVAAATGMLGLPLLCAVQFATGVGTVFFDVAYQSYLPTLVGREQLMEGNGRLEASRSVAYAAGPSVAGYLVQVLTAPVAVLVDAASYLWSAAWIAAIRGREPAVPAPGRRLRAMRREMGEGLRLVLDHPVLRSLILYNTVTVLFLSVERAMGVVFLMRTVGLTAGGVGVLFSVADLGVVLGALAAAPLGRRFGAPRIILAAALVGNAFLMLVPLAAAGPRVAFYGVGAAVNSFCIVVFNIVSMALRQRLCPDQLLGRMSATSRFLSWSMAPTGTLLGGALGTAVGLRPTLLLSTTGCLLPALWLLRSPLARIRVPAPPAPGTAETSCS